MSGKIRTLFLSVFTAALVVSQVYAQSVDSSFYQNMSMRLIGP
jgi:hypothetical protein